VCISTGPIIIANMNTHPKIQSLFILFCLAIIFTIPALAQSEELVFSLSRDFGYEGFNGVDIQGTFSMKVSGPANLVKVTFYIDDQAIGEDTEAPFRLQFNTDRYMPGMHSLSAIGTTSDGKELQSKVIQKKFVTAAEGGKAALTIVGPILILVLGITLISAVGPLLIWRKRSNLPLGTPRNYGISGGAICPRCKRPFPLHMIAPNLLVGKLERCPHCGRVSIVSRASQAQLKAAEEAELAKAAGDKGQVTGMTEEEKLRKEIDDSRFQGM